MNPMPATAGHRPSRMAWLAASALLILHAFLALWAVSGKSVTYDEILHVTAGYFYNELGDFRLHPENGVLPQRWAAVPASVMGAPAPILADNEYWRTSSAGVIGHQFFYETGHDHWPMLMGGRALALVFSLATGLLVFAWAGHLFGSAGGLLALAFYVLDPNVLAHAALTTSDSPATFFLLASVSAFWMFVRRPGPGRLALSAAAFGLASVAKFSAVLLPVMFGFLLAWHLAVAGRAERRRWLTTLPLAAGVHVAVALLVIWAFFDFRYPAWAAGVPPADHFAVPWEQFLPQMGLHGTLVGLARDARLLPEAFLYGYALVAHSVQARAAFLAGEYTTTGWVHFFPLAFAWKTTLALLTALAVMLFAGIRRWRTNPRQLGRDAQRVAPLAVLFAVYWAVSLTSGLNIGHRHLLPTYPVLFILAGSLASAAILPGLARLVVPAALVVGLAIANARTAPHYLAFFNVIAGGPANGWRLLSDSSVDWGQDLPGLKAWIDQHAQGAPVCLSYFGSGEPAYYRIKGRRLAFANTFKFPTTYVPLEPGLYCISATMLQQVYSPVRGPWTIEFEREFQSLRMLEPALAEPARRAALHPQLSLAQWHALTERFEHLRFARLCHVLRARGPDAHVGHSILIFRLTAEEIAGATGGSLREWQAAIERGARRHPCDVPE